jgi:DNA processing protein
VPHLTKSTDLDKLRLIRSPNIGPVTYRQLIGRFGDAASALRALPDLIARGGGRNITLASASEVEAEFAATLAFGAKYIFIDDPDYPGLLSEIDNAPPVFNYVGDTSLLSRISVSIVGARNASASACRFARQLAYDLGNEGIVVTSGLARGIDTAAHVGALQSGTIGVIAGGIDVVYPPENRDLQAAVAAQGLLIAEQPFGTEPRARHFPHRNRIIAALSRGTVVVEAAPKSGSLITSRLAAEAGREVMAVPGSPMDPRARGCNHLIREGATLVQDAQDIAELIRPIVGSIMRQPRADSQPSLLADLDIERSDSRQVVTNLLGMTSISVDEIVRQSGLPPSQVQMVLLELELAGRLERGAGSKVKLSA